MTAQPTYATSPFGATPLRPAPARPTPPRRRTGRTLAVTGTVLLVLVGLALAAQHFFFTTRTVSPPAVQDEVARLTEAAVGIAPTDVRCPAGLAARAGATFTCTGTVDGQPVTWWVRQVDDRGAVTVTADRLLRLDALERDVAAKLAADLRTAVTVDCGPAGRTVLRNTPGQGVDCTATGTTAATRTVAAKTRTLPMTVTVDEDGAVAYRLR